MKICSIKIGWKILSIFISCILFSLILASCDEEPDYSKYVIKDSWTTWISPLDDYNKLEYGENNFVPFPVKIVIDGIGPSQLIDTWRIPGYAQEGYPDYKWDLNDPFNIAIHNQHDEDTTFELYFIRTTMISVDGETSLEYNPTPDGIENWIRFPNGAYVDGTYKVRVKAYANSIVHIPLAIITPKSNDLGKKLPERWEFQIGIKDLSQTGMIVTGINIRFLISMRDGWYK
jgi:hypothetical protein